MLATTGLFHPQADSKVMKHLVAHNILSEKQHGFCKYHSCEYQLLPTISDLTKGLDDKQKIDATPLDFSQVFDRVPHEWLLGKLDFYYNKYGETCFGG